MLQYHLRILSVGSRLRDGGAVSAKRGGEPALSGVSSPHPDPYAAVGAPVQYARPTVTADRNSRVVRWQGRSVAQLGFVNNTVLALTTASIGFASPGSRVAGSGAYWCSESCISSCRRVLRSGAQ